MHAVIEIGRAAGVAVRTLETVGWLVDAIERRALMAASDKNLI